MATTTKDTLAFQLLANKLNVLHGRDGDFTALTTTEKASLVSAINEVHAMVVSASMIDDSQTSPTSIYSSAKTLSEINSAIWNALEGEDLSDLAASVAALAQADTGLVSTAAAQSFDDVAKAQARSNIGAAGQADLDTANASIATNTGNISSNTAAIGTNTADIATNSANIAGIVTDIAANETAIAANGSAITANQVAHVANAAAHVANAAATASNAGAITQLQTDLGDAQAYDPVGTINGILTF